MTALHAYAALIILALLCAALARHAWRHLGDAAVLPTTEQEAVRELEQATNLPVKTRAKTVNAVYCHHQKPGKKGLKHKRKVGNQAQGR